MAEGTGADVVRLFDTEKEIDQVATDLTQRLNGLMNELATCKEAWVGSSGLSFQAVQTQFNDAVSQLNAQIRGIAEQVGSHGKNLTVDDDELRQEMTAAGATDTQITSALTMN